MKLFDDERYLTISPPDSPDGYKTNEGDDNSSDENSEDFDDDADKKHTVNKIVYKTITCKELKSKI